MTTPDVPLRLELAVELPGTPEQVWEAVATARGISAWFVPTEVDERAGGSIVFHMGPDESPGTITDWSPPGRLEYSEPGWADLSGHEDASVTPLVTEFLVEARSGGTCVVRVVSSAFGSGAQWEQEFFDQMEEGWTPYFEHLRLYLAHFPGQTATRMDADTDVATTAAGAVAGMLRKLGIDADTKDVDLRDLTGVVEHLGDQQVLVRLTDPLPGFVTLYAYDKGEALASAQVAAYLFSPGAAAYVEREQPAWQTWLQDLVADA